MDTDLNRLLSPRAIAIVGATPDVKRIGGQPVRQLTEFGYQGGVYPVNPRYTDIRGLPCFADVSAVPKPCDVALIAVGATHVPGVIEQCGAAGIPFAIVLSAGFREIGGEGVALEAKLREAIRSSGVRAVGPNCLGLMNLRERIFAGFGPGFQNPNLRQGPIAMVSQSGGFAFSVVGLADQEGIGFNYIVSGGNEVDLSSVDLLAAFLEREEVEVLVCYLEGVSDGRKLLALGARALALKKPILVWKTGNSAVGRVAAASHTASMTAGYELYRAAFAQGGFIEIEDVHDLVDCARAFMGRRLPKGNRVAIVTTSGGSGVLMTDRCDASGLAVPQFADSTIAELRTFLPSFSAFSNPADFTAQVTGNHALFNRGVELALADPNMDQIIVRYGSVQGAGSEVWAQGMVDLTRRSDKPVMMAWSRPVDLNSPSMKIIQEHRIPWSLTPTRAAKAMGALNQFADKCRRIVVRPLERCVVAQTLDLPPGAESLGEHASKQLLARYGIAVTREVLLSPAAIEAMPAIPLSFPLSFPLAVKIESPDIAHKTEAGAVRLGVTDLAGLRSAAREVLASARRFRPDARIDGILICEMAAGLEVIVGCVNDPYFGPTVMFGLGGIATELLRDVSYRFAPFDAKTAREMVLEIRAAPLLTGYRGRPALDVEALADVLSRLSLLAADHSTRIAEIDVNPLFVRTAGQGVVAADALVVTR